MVTTDGTTLLGSDDKSGIAEIMTAIEYLVAHPEIKHGEIRVGFGPDEEIGVGANKFDVDDFNVDFACDLQIYSHFFIFNVVAFFLLQLFFSSKSIRKL